MVNKDLDFKRKNLQRIFLDFSKYHRPWLKELARRYKEAGNFPMMPPVILASFYEDQKDKEVAAFLSVFLTGESYDGIQAFREMLGESPWRWFEQREFVKLSIGEEANKKTGGATNWKIAGLMDRLWNECRVNTYGETFIRPIGVQVSLMAKAHNCGMLDVLTYLAEDGGFKNFFYRLRLLAMTLCTNDGFGISLWQDDENLPCPHATGMETFVAMWFPEWKKACSLDEAIKLFGFDRDCDFFYAFLGYKEMQKRNPKECSIHATTYLRWLNCQMKKPYKWRGLLQEIPF